MAAQKDEQMADLARRIAPHLAECGIIGFVLAGYKTDGEGKISRITIGGAENPALSDGLRPLERSASMWGQGVL